MGTNVKFGECLKLLLSALDISINRLSKSINVDTSLVNRWVHGRRIPSYNSNYIDIISEYLFNNIQNSFQKQKLNELLLNVCENHYQEDNMKEKIRHVLKESQGYSFECKKSEIKVNRSDLHKRSNNIESIALSGNDKIIFGIENIFSAGSSLLRSALNQPYKKSNIIYITYNDDFNVKTFSCSEFIKWKELLLKALNKGWHIVLLLKITNDITKTMNFIKIVLPHIKTGRLNIYYYKKYESLKPAKETFIISDIGALSCFSTAPDSEISCAFYLESTAAVNIFKDHFNVILETHGKPLMKFYTQNLNSNYRHLLVETEKAIGNRFVFNYDFSMTLLPENLLEKLLLKKKLSHNKILTTMQLYRKHTNAIINNIPTYEYRDIYFADSIEKLICSRQFHICTCSGMESIELEVNEIIDFMYNIIDILNKYDNYHIAFEPRNNDDAYNNYYCMVKERQSVFFEVFDPAANQSEVRLSIEEPTFVKAIEEYFNEIWEHIAPVSKDKVHIITWLQNQINLLKRQQIKQQ